MRPRGDNGQFLQSVSSSRSSQSLSNQRSRQKSYIARRRRMRKRVVCSFVRKVIVKDDGKLHWIPASTKHGHLFDLMDNLLKDAYRESRRTRLTAVKAMYFNGESRSTDRLPKVTVRDADMPLSKSERVSAFVRWRFPFAVDSYEMDNLKKWLRQHEQMLRVSVRDPLNICINTFNKYTKCSNKYFYTGYPLQSNGVSSFQTAEPQTLVTERNANDTSGLLTEAVTSVPLSVASPRRETQQESHEHVHTTRTQLYFEVRANRIMAAAEDDVLYQSLLRALNPNCNVQFSVLCHVSISRFHDGKPPDDWCTL